MTVSTTASRIRVVGAGTADPIPVPYTFDAPTDLRVIRTAGGVDAVLALTTDYTVAGGLGSTGSVTPTAPIPNGTVWTIQRVTARDQGLDLDDTKAFPAESVERSLDKLTRIAQELDDASARSLVFPPSDPAAALGPMPAAAARAGGFLSFDGDGKPQASAGTPSVPVSDYWAGILNDPDASGLPPASASAPGVIQLATTAQALALTETAAAMSPDLVRRVVNSLFVGDLRICMGSALPEGCQWADGRNLVRADFPTLFARYGTDHGAGNGTTTFGIPDMRGRVPVGRDDMGGTAANRIQVSTTISTTNSSTSATAASAAGLTVGMVVTSANVPAGTTITAISGTTITLSAAASATASGTAARFSVLGNAQALGAAGGSQTHTQIVAQLAAHTHPLSPSVVNTAAGFSSWNGGGSYNAMTETGSTGSGQPMNNVQPSLTTNIVVFAGIGANP